MNARRALSAALLSTTALAQGPAILPINPVRPGPVIPVIPTNPGVTPPPVRTDLLLPADLVAYFRNLQRSSPLTKPTGLNTSAPGPAGTTAVPGSGGAPLACTTRKVTMQSAPERFAASGYDQDKLWLGSLLQAQSLKDGIGALRAAYVPEDKRLPLKITSAAPVAVASQTIQPNQSAYNVALAKIRQGMQGTALGSTVSYRITEEKSFESSALKLGLNAHYLTARVSGEFQSSTTTSRNRVTAVFMQEAFTENVALNSVPAAGLFHDLSVEGAAEFEKTRQWGPGNPPVLVNSITYGRLLFVSMESNYSAAEMQIALKAAYEGAAAGGDASLNVQTSKVLADSTFDVYAVGGDEEAVISLIRTQQLASYFAKTTNPTTFQPISFTVINLADGTKAADLRAGEYAETTCNLASMKLFLKVQVYAQDTDDNSYDDVYGTMHVNGTQLWRRGTEDPYELYRGTTVYLYPEDTRYIYNRGTTPFTLDADMTTDQYAKFEASFTDFDKWPNGDDFLGSVNENINVSAVARYFRDNPSATFYSYRDLPLRAKDNTYQIKITFYKSW